MISTTLIWAATARFPFASKTGRLANLTAQKPECQRMGRLRRVVLLGSMICVSCSFGIAQQTLTDPLPDAPASQQAPPPTQSVNPIRSSVALFTLLQSKSLVFPDIATNRGPLDTWDKFKLAANNSVSVSTVGAALLGSGFSQALNTPSGYGQGGEGYAKRFGADMARSASSNIFGNFVLASALHQDPRFYVKKHLSFWQSVEYAAVRVVKTRSDSGEEVVNYSGLIGPLLAEGLANSYYPDQNRTVHETFTRFGSDLGWKFGGNLLRQYWPVLNRKLQLAPEHPAQTN